MDRITVYIPGSFEKERTYVLDVLFSEFIGIPVDIEVANITCYRVVYNDRFFEVQDHFFNDKESYIDAKYLPTDKVINTSWLLDHMVPVLYGTEEIIEKENCVQYGFDIFASAFFMLTRWEEIVVEDRDQHGRFPGKKSIAGRWGFIEFPVVNHYALLLELWCEKHFNLRLENKRKLRIFLTHDVDVPLLWRSTKILAQQSYINLFERYNLNQVSRDVRSFMKRRKRKDPWDTFGRLMNIAENLGTKAHFYFIPDGELNHETCYKLQDPFIQKLIANIKDREHIIGIHPSYFTFNDEKLLRMQMEKLKCEGNIKDIKYGRQHFLRFQVPDTWQIWDNVGLKYDSTVYYADLPGYRCGSCYSFPVFNVRTGKRLNLIELPLIFMEQSFVGYTASGTAEMEDYLKQCIAQIKAFQGDFVSLWHNSSFYTPEFRPFEEIPEKMVEWLK